MLSSHPHRNAPSLARFVRLDDALRTLFKRAMLRGDIA